jgi:chromosome transmission fidelity protein 18
MHIYIYMYIYKGVRDLTHTHTHIDSNKYLGRLTNAVMSNGEIERIMQGCFESFPSMRFHDVALSKFCQMSEWLEFYDMLNHRTNDKHEYELYKYLPYPIVNFHRFFAGSSSQEHRVEYPRIEYEVFSTKKSYENLIAIFLSGIHVSKRRYLNRDMIANELVPLLMPIISPELKPVSLL